MITVEWFLVALLAVFLVGWFAARLDIRDIRKSGRELPRAYLQGLSHLLRDEKRQALDAFLRVEALDPESAELQFAIGDLSRQRGEYRRALDAHQRLCEREDLPAEEGTRARWELARDYFQMGFLDVAEKHAATLADNPDYGEQASGMLLEIRQRARDYAEALTILDRAPAALTQRKTRAHLLCELALRMDDEQAAEKRKLLQDAIRADGNCARASILLGDLALAGGDAKQAAAHYAAVERQNIAYLWRAVEGALQAREAAGHLSAGAAEVRRWLESYPSEALFSAVYRGLAARGLAGDLAAAHLPLGLAAAAAWANERARAEPDTARQLWRDLEKTTSPNIRQRCENCGYVAANFAWQCHNCLAWESFRPIAAES